jgi:hypothetical protein
VISNLCARVAVASTGGSGVPRSSSTPPQCSRSPG